MILLLFTMIHMFELFFSLLKIIIFPLEHFNIQAADME